MAQNIYQTLQARTNTSQLPPMEKRAMYWFKNYSTELTLWQKHTKNLSFDKLKSPSVPFTKQLVNARYVTPGVLYFYLYDPKLKKTLPYYDRFPFTLVLHRYDDGFLGLNFHYLDYRTRAQFFDVLYEHRIGRASRPDVRDIRMRLDVDYGMLKTVSRMKAFRPCIKRYLFKHLQSPLLKVGASEWETAIFLPVARFQKEPETVVWKESLKKIR